MQGLKGKISTVILIFPYCSFASTVPNFSVTIKHGFTKQKSVGRFVGFNQIHVLVSESEFYRSLEKKEPEAQQ